MEWKNFLDGRRFSSVLKNIYFRFRRKEFFPIKSILLAESIDPPSMHCKSNPVVIRASPGCRQNNAIHIISPDIKHGSFWCITVNSVIPSFRSKSSKVSKMISPKTGRNSANTSGVIFLSFEYSSVNLDGTPSACRHLRNRNCLHLNKDAHFWNAWNRIEVWTFISWAEVQASPTLAPQ